MDTNKCIYLEIIDKERKILYRTTEIKDLADLLRIKDPDSMLDRISFCNDIFGDMLDCRLQENIPYKTKDCDMVIHIKQDEFEMIRCGRFPCKIHKFQEKEKEIEL